MNALVYMFPGAVNSPETFIISELSETDTNITVQNAAGFANVELPFLLVLGGSFSNAETVKVITINANTLTVERGYQSAAQKWPQGTTAAINFTEAHYRALVENISTLHDNENTLSGALAAKMPAAPPDGFYFGRGINWHLASDADPRAVVLVSEQLAVELQGDIIKIPEKIWHSHTRIPINVNGAQIVYDKNFTQTVFYAMGADATLYSFIIDPEAYTVAIADFPVGERSNILHNWDFRNPVNQLGLGTYTGHRMSIDRWHLLGAASSLTITSGGITLAANTRPIQVIEYPEQYNGLTVTLSIEVVQNTRDVAFNFSMTRNHITTEAGNVAITIPAGATGIFSATGRINNMVGMLAADMRTNTGQGTVTISRVKLELGTKSTLVNDPPMDFGVELTKCQRYQIALLGVNADTRIPIVDVGIGAGQQTFIMSFDLPVTLRAHPAIRVTSTNQHGRIHGDRNGVNLFRRRIPISGTTFVLGGDNLTQQAVVAIRVSPNLLTPEECNNRLALDNWQSNGIILLDANI